MKLPWRPRLASSSAALPLRRLFSAAAAPAATPVNRVTRLNFEPVLEELRTSIREADFVAVDLEMTGIASAPWREALELDRADVRYLKANSCSLKGISRYSVSLFSHNFYVLPCKELHSAGPSSEFICQTSSVDFLAKHNFDFNTWIHEGISYLSRVQEAEALRVYSLVSGMEHNTLKHVEKIPMASASDILFTERMKIRLREWQEKLFQNSSLEDLPSTSSQQQFQTVFYKLRPAILLNGFTSHQLRLVKLVVGKYFEDLIFVCANVEDSSQKKLVVYSDSEKDKSLLMKEVDDDFQTASMEKVKVAVGLRHVIDLIVSHKKLVVGHNCFLDMAHIYNKFFGPLPSSIEKFASSLHESFPYIVDTKHLIKAERVIREKMGLKGTYLSRAFTLLCPQIAFSSPTSDIELNSLIKVHVRTDEKSSSSWNTGHNHEAGYDAFMTGCVFAQACNHLGINFKKTSLTAGWIEDSIINKYVNLLYLGCNSMDVIDLRTSCRIEDLSLGASKFRFPKFTHCNIVVLWGISSKLTTGMLKECIDKAFGSDSISLIYRLDETAVFVQFKNKERMADFLALKDSLDCTTDLVSLLHPLAKILEGPTTHAATYEAYKQIVSSPLAKFTFAEQAAASGVKWKFVADTMENKEHIPPEKADIDIVIDKVVLNSAGSLRKNQHHHLNEKLMDALSVNDSQLLKRTTAI